MKPSKLVMITLSAMFVILSLQNAQANNAQERVLTNKTVFDASIQRVWKAWTDTDELKAWNAPKGEVIFELKLDGRFYTNHDGKIGDPGTIRNRILSYVPEKMCSFKLGFPENFTAFEPVTGKRCPDFTKPVEIPEVLQAESLFSVLEFVDLGNGKTEFIARLVGFKTGSQWDAVYTTFDCLNEMTLRTVKAYLEKERR